MKYKDYLKTDYWKIVSETARQRAGNKCQLCGCADKKLHVHHNSYDHIGQEHLFPEDLICLCEDCHGNYHKKINLIEEQNKIIDDLYNIINKKNNELSCLQVENEYMKWKLNNWKRIKNKMEKEIELEYYNELKYNDDDDDDLPF